MADTQVYGSPSGTQEQRRGLWGPYWTDKDTGLIIEIDSGADIRFHYTTNAGSTWTSDVINDKVMSGTFVHMACWFDKETPGDSGDLVHVVGMDSGTPTVNYRTIDVTDRTLGTERTVDSGVTISSTPTLNRCAITKTVSGNIIVAFETQTEIECYKSSDNFATAGTDIADVYETAGEEDWCLLYPAATADNNDAAALFHDRSANAITVKMYDDSADSWTETAIDNATDSATYCTMDGAVRHSDSHILLALHEDPDSGFDNIATWDITPDSIASPTVTSKTNVASSIGESVIISMFINQQNDDVYAVYNVGGTWQSSVDIVYKKSTNDMSTWGSEQSYSEATADDNRIAHAGRTVGDDGGRFQPTWYNDDTTDDWVNLVNDVEIAAATPATGFTPKIIIY